MEKLSQAQMEKLAEVQNVLLEDFRIPAFEKRCADLGIKFASEEDFRAALETVAMLRIKEAQLREEGVDPNPSPIKAAGAMLKQSMTDIFETPEEKPAQSDRLRQAVQNLASA